MKAMVFSDRKRKFDEYCKYDTASITSSLEEVMTTSEKEGHENRDVANIYISGKYFNTDTNEHGIMLLKERLTELVALAEPKLFIKYLTIDKNVQAMLYTKL